MGGNISADVFRHASVEAKFFEVAYGEIRKKREHSSKGCMRIPNQPQPDIIATRPLFRGGDQFYNLRGEVRSSDNAGHMSFSEVRVIQNGSNQFLIVGKQQAGGDMAGTLPGERDFLAAGNSLRLFENSFLGNVLHVRGDGGSLADTNQIEEVEEFEYGK